LLSSLRQRRYGTDAASASQDVSQAAQDVYDTALAAKGLKAKSIVKAAAKETVKQVVVVRPGVQGAAAGGEAAGASCVVTELEEAVEEGGPWVDVGAGGSGVAGQVGAGALVGAGHGVPQGGGKGAGPGGGSGRGAQTHAQAPLLAAGKYYPAVPAPELHARQR
jgi:hypothetical protein